MSSPARPAGRLDETVQALRVLLLVLAALGLVGTVASTSLSAGERALVARAQAGEVALLQVDAVPEDGLSPSLLGAAPLPERRTGVVAWVDGSGVRTLVEGSSLPEDADLLATVLRAAPEGQRPEVVTGPLRRDHLALLWQLSGVLVLVVLVLGPQPRRATKWGWTWLLVAVPGGLGTLALLLREAPWSRSTRAEPAPPPRLAVPGVRMSGGTGLLVALAVGAVLGLAPFALELLPVAAEPQPAPFEVVRLDGTTEPAGR